MFRGKGKTSFPREKRFSPSPRPLSLFEKSDVFFRGPFLPLLFGDQQHEVVALERELGQFLLRKDVAGPEILQLSGAGDPQFLPVDDELRPDGGTADVDDGEHPVIRKIDSVKEERLPFSFQNFVLTRTEGIYIVNTKTDEVYYKVL